MNSWRMQMMMVAVTATVLVATLRAGAETEEDEKGRRVREIAESINSPFCPATTLASCGSAHAAAWRNDIRRWVDDGLTKNEICARLEERAHHKLCVGPRTPWMWSLPFLLAGASIAVLAFLLRRFVRPETGEAKTSASPAPTPEDQAATEPETGPAEGVPESSELDAQLDRELSELDTE